jgi:hypothetical protein
VTIEITRRGLNIDLNAQLARPGLSAADLLRPLGPSDVPPDLRPQHGPPHPAMDLRWFTDNLDRRRQDPEIIELLARYVDEPHRLGSVGAEPVGEFAGAQPCDPDSRWRTERTGDRHHQPGQEGP